MIALSLPDSCGENPSCRESRDTRSPFGVSSLPDAQRRRFPNLEFSTHIYADDADLRAIVVNGSRLEEGDRLQNLVLSQITEEGAVFRFEGQLVSVSVLDDWN
jgi:general secretion pathway protein B